MTTDEGERSVTLAINQVGDQLRGTIQGALGSATINNGSIAPDGAIKFSATVTTGGTTEGSDIRRDHLGERRARHDERRRASAVDVRRLAAGCGRRRPARSSADAALAVREATGIDNSL